MPSFPEAKKERIDYDMAADSTDDVLFEPVLDAGRSGS